MKTLFSSIVLGLLFASASAQLLYNRDAIILQAGATLTVQGTITNTTGSSLDNAGTITLSGDWLNNTTNGLLSPNKGTVVLKGTTQQTIGGTQATTFNNLDIIGTGVSIKLAVNTTVGGTTGLLTLGSKPLLLNQHTLTLTNPANAAIVSTTGSLVEDTPNPLSHLNRNIGIRTGSYLYPIGSQAGALIPVTVNITTAGVGTSGSLDLATYPTGADNLPLPSGATNVNGQPLRTLDRFWIITPQNYTSLPTATVTFSYQDGEWGGGNTITEANLRLYRWNGTSWVLLTSTNNVTNNTLTVSNLNQFGIFMVAVPPAAPVSPLASSTSRLGDQTELVEGDGEPALAAQVYPNPTAGLLHLQLDNALDPLVEVTIRNATGQLLQQNCYERSGESFSALLDLSAQPRGVYLVQIRVNGKTLIRKVIVE